MSGTDPKATGSGERGSRQLRLYVAGSSPRSVRAVQNLKRVCEAELEGRYNLEVVDIYKEPRRAVEDEVVAIPTLINHVRGFVHRLSGDLGEIALLREALGL